jgi:hypothetical protein
MMTRLPLAVLLAAWCTLCAGQGTVYESKDKAGPVFSDQASPGSKPVQLGPPNVIDVGPSVAPTGSAAPVASYQSLAIAVPADGATIHSNTGEFAVRVRAKPSLQASQGDGIRIKLDGNLLPRTYSSSSFRITATDWQGAATSDTQHTLQAAIVNSGGAVILESAPVNFYVHRATVNKAKR